MYTRTRGIFITWRVKQVGMNVAYALECVKTVAKTNEQFISPDHHLQCITNARKQLQKLD